MRFFLFNLLIFSPCHVGTAEQTVLSTAPKYEFRVRPDAEKLLNSYCYECHDSGLSKGGIRFDNLATLSEGQRLERLNYGLEMLFSGEMPPKKGDQPTVEERDKLSEWMWGELKSFNASKLEDKLRYYKYANYISHEKLFSGTITEKPFTKARRWRVNEMIYQERINDVFELEGNKRRDPFFGVVKPFNLPTESGVHYYDTEIVEGGQFLTLMSNAKWVVDKQLRYALVKSGEYHFSEDYLAAQANGGRGFLVRFPDEAWNPERSAEPFQRIIMESGPPTDELLADAINHQFRVALQRDPSPSEMAKYLGFTKDTLKISDKTSALKKMMVSVLMEPEFLYRNEFGDGERDGSGRMMQTPREGSYAIAYALTDRIPDAALVEAAKSGKLNTRADYEHEVRRILGDDSIAKPRILRFFQDYFGYQGIYNVFKDEERFAGAYNPHRVVAAKYIYRVPGKISKEADTLVNWVLENDKDVLTTLLTTDRFFVEHNGNNAEMAKKAAEATKDYATFREMYQRTKGMKGPQAAAVVAQMDRENPELNLAKRFLSPDGKVRGILMSTITRASFYFGADGKKDEGTGKVYMPHDPEAIEHSVKMYNLDYTTWSYQAEQPMQFENRIGMLTHPAWLVANSHNAATDPIRRGKWVREKLLGGFIRDVPITVDAKVPENPDQTLRERFSVTEQTKCWQCHERMNPLGYVFESFDDFGRFRTQEPIEYPENILSTNKVKAKDMNGIYKDFNLPVYKTKPVNPLGRLEGTGDPSLDGEVKDVKDLMTRLAKSERVRQVFIRNVFRYYMGRNETLADSQTLIEADRVYQESSGSFKELTISLLTSDSFIYRK
jgi:hypothetical protein